LITVAHAGSVVLATSNDKAKGRAPPTKLTHQHGARWRASHFGDLLASWSLNQYSVLTLYECDTFVIFDNLKGVSCR